MYQFSQGGYSTHKYFCLVLPVTQSKVLDSLLQLQIYLFLPFLILSISAFIYFEAVTITFYFYDWCAGRFCCFHMLLVFLHFLPGVCLALCQVTWLYLLLSCCVFASASFSPLVSVCNHQALGDSMWSHLLCQSDLTLNWIGLFAMSLFSVI